jgi:phosphoribosyl 1,2-cyclic phosphate phosphodiesterase
MKVRVLGCGSSGGVPLIGCQCPVCVSDHPRNKRTRVSIVVEEGPTRVLVDAPPDLRQQFLTAGLATVDAVIITHAHADHTHGIDDLRTINFNKKGPLDVWATAGCLAEVRARFDYAFQEAHPTYSWYAPVLVPRALTVGSSLRIGSLDIATFLQGHGEERGHTLGLRFGRFAYSTDAKTLSDEAFAALAGVEVWLVDCLTEKPNFGHSHLEQTLAWIERLKPRRAILTHMNHGVDYESWTARMPAGVELAYDGMEIEMG